MSVFGWEVPPYAVAYPYSEDVQVTVPSTYRADSVLVFNDADGDPVMAVVVEVQRAFDRAKQRTWPLYLAHTEATFDVTSALLVYCPSSSVGSRYRALWSSHPGSLLVKPFVITPDDIPLVTDVAAAAADPALAVLGVLAHADAPHAGFPALIAALTSLGREQRLAYHDMVTTGLTPTSRQDWRTFMNATTQGSQFLSEEFRAIEAKGIEQGRAEATALSVLRFLAAREVQVSAEQRRRIEGEVDLEVLDSWVVRAATAESCAEVLAD